MTLQFAVPVTEEEAWSDERVIAGVYEAASPAPGDDVKYFIDGEPVSEATMMNVPRPDGVIAATAWFFYCITSAAQDEIDDYYESGRYRRDCAYRRAGF